MNDFQLGSACPGCGYAGNGIESPHNPAQRCPARAIDVPLRCEHSADPAELAQWPQEKYEKDGLYYKPITTTIMHNGEKEVDNPDFKPEEEESDTNKRTIVIPTERLENVLDEAATIAAGPLTVPRTIPHVHRTCRVCETRWPELLKG